MNQKIKLTKYVAEQIGLSTEEKFIKRLLPLWWQNPRIKEKGGLGLTEQGFACLQQADIKCHRVGFEEPTPVNNSMLLWIDRNIDCPFYITHKDFYLRYLNNLYDYENFPISIEELFLKKSKD